MAHDEEINEQALWKYAGWGILIAMVMFGAIGFAVLTVAGSDAPLLARLGTSVYIGFWGGPVFGMAGGVGYHDLVQSRRAAKAVPPGVAAQPVTA